MREKTPTVIVKMTNMPIAGPESAMWEAMKDCERQP